MMCVASLSLCCPGAVCAPREVPGPRSRGSVHPQSCAPDSVGPRPQLCPEHMDGCWDQTRGRPGSRQRVPGAAHAGGCSLFPRGLCPPRKVKSRYEDLALPGHCFHLRCGGGRQGGVSAGPSLPQGRTGDKNPSGHLTRARPAEHQPHSSCEAHSVPRFPHSSGAPMRTGLPAVCEDSGRWCWRGSGPKAKAFVLAFPLLGARLMRSAPFVSRKLMCNWF